MYKYELAISTNIQQDFIQKSPENLFYCDKTHTNHFMIRYRKKNKKNQNNIGENNVIS